MQSGGPDHPFTLSTRENLCDLITQNMLHYLARCIAGQRLNQDHVTRFLVGGEVIPSERHYFFAGYSDPRAGNNRCAYCLAPVLIGYSNNRNLKNARVAVKYFLDFS